MRVNDPIQGIFFSAKNHVIVKRRETAPRTSKLVRL